MTAWVAGLLLVGLLAASLPWLVVMTVVVFRTTRKAW